MNKNVYVDTIYLAICNSVIHTSVKNASHLKYYHHVARQQQLALAVIVSRLDY